MGPKRRNLIENNYDWTINTPRGLLNVKHVIFRLEGQQRLYLRETKGQWHEAAGGERVNDQPLDVGEQISAVYSRATESK